MLDSEIFKERRTEQRSCPTNIIININIKEVLFVQKLTMQWLGKVQKYSLVP